MSSELSLTFIGNATVVLRLGSFSILTDPNFLHRGERAYLGYGLVSKRLTEPAMSIDELPPLDAVVLSHMHGDHWDRRARSGLDKQLPVITTRHAAKRLRVRDGFGAAVGLHSWDSYELAKEGYALSITSLPGVHSTSRVLRALLPPVMGSLLELRDPAGVVIASTYLTGDTMLFDGIDEIGERCPHIDTAVVHLGGTMLPGGFIVTMDGADGAELLRRVKPRVAVPVHYDDYSVFTSGLDDFRGACSDGVVTAEIRIAERGSTIPLPNRWSVGATE
jgi:L-ascorbate metabolism protein UlaG (beta-lactamase superfamily)